MNNEIKKSRSGRVSIESIVLGILALISSCVFFLLIPGRPFGISIIKPIDAQEEFVKYVFMLYFIMLFGVIVIGSSITAIITGIKDFRGIDRGLYINKGKSIYIAGIVLGTISIILFFSFLIIINI